MTWKDQIIVGFDQLSSALAAAGAPMRTAGRVPNYKLPGNALAFEFHVNKPQSFQVSCWLWDSEARVHFDSWHADFEDSDPPSDVFKMAAFGLSERCFLRVTMAGRRPIQWQLWTQRGEEMQPDSELGVLALTFRGKRRTVDLRNAVLPWDEARWNHP